MHQEGNAAQDEDFLRIQYPLGGALGFRQVPTRSRNRRCRRIQDRIALRRLHVDSKCFFFLSGCVIPSELSLSQLSFQRTADKPCEYFLLRHPATLNNLGSADEGRPRP